MALNRSEFFSASGLASRLVPLGGDKGDVWVREMTAMQVAEFVRLQKSGKDAEALAYVITTTLCVDGGSLMLTSEDTEVAKNLPSTLANAVVTAALELSGLTEKKAS